MSMIIFFLVLNVCVSLSHALEDNFKAKVLERLASEESLIASLRKEIKQIKEENHDLQKSLQTFISQQGRGSANVQKLRAIRAGSASVGGNAFFARLNHTISGPGNSFTIPFNDVVANDGLGFSGHGTGIFRALSTGEYFFTWTITVGQNQQIKSQLVKNGSPVSDCISAASPGDYGTGTGSAILQLDNGDEIWIRVQELITSKNYTLATTSIQNRFTSFSGFQIM